LINQPFEAFKVAAVQNSEGYLIKVIP